MACKGILVLYTFCLIVIFFSMFIFSHSLTTSSLNQGHVLNATDLLVSRNGLFTLGFTGRYLVINYTALDGYMITSHPLWIANRDAPIVEDSGALTIDNLTGTLKIVRKGGKPIELFSGYNSNGNLTAVLLDNGNFVLKEANSSSILWQSFDYPTDTLLPGMKLGINHKTGKKWLLRSWQAEDNPIPGGFTLEWDTSQRQIAVRRRGVLFWTSGVLTPDNTIKTWIWIVISILIALILAFMSVFLYLRWKRLRKFLKELMTDDRATDVDELQNNGNRGHNLEIYNVAKIMAATNSFSLHNKLGEGGFGPVYKGRLTEGQEIAVKRLSSKSGQGLLEFKNELIVIAKLQHMNLVRLLGFCIQGEEKMLVYEYMPNKSLDSFIFDQSRREVLDWSRRLNIIEGIAQGLLYLHKYSRLRIIHRDLKASNILLDKDMNPKISDFGLARIFRQNESEANTCTLVGTRGYMSPEYLMEGIVSIKSDVYSFGVLVLEIISGKKNHNVYHHDRPLNLVCYAWELWKEDSLLQILEPAIRDSASEDQVLRCIHVGLLCVERSPRDRPTMSDVLFMLTNEAQQLPAPKQPAFYIGENSVTMNPSERNMKTGSINGMSVSEMDGR
ncbi:ATP binding protein, putative [Ricinus communis]|uniref:non-specific serine/threonine protein kinase n=1 Tax=Ricinus communis TaxID=3988 RepID=B9SQR5_RICCO|nr:ATP binding protein, putative [Ricinus communis]